ncbi:MAG: 3-hydroxyacyl-ACP dehydratase FabZ family protein [Planctomycetaceae bacterium]
MRFALVDRIDELRPRESLTAVKNLSMAEEYLADHFPGFPVMPGVMMLETLIQSSAWLMRYSEDFRYSMVLLTQARAVRFNNFVTPGNTLVVNIRVHKWGDSECVLQGTGTVNDQSAVNARLTLRQFNPSDENPELKNSDELRTSKMRALFAQICPEELRPASNAGSPSRIGNEWDR